MSAILEQVEPETILALELQARATGLSVDEYLKGLLGVSNNFNVRKNVGTDEFIAAMETLATGTENLSPSAITYSRRDIYLDHD